jgi:hypothetical protein
MFGAILGKCPPRMERDVGVTLDAGNWLSPAIAVQSEDIPWMRKNALETLA